MKTKTFKKILIGTEINGSSWFSPEGYSKYTERHDLENKNLLPIGDQAYGIQQAHDHIEEMRKFEHPKGSGRFPHKNKKFFITSEVIVQTMVEVIDLRKPTREHFDNGIQLFTLLNQRGEIKNGMNDIDIRHIAEPFMSNPEMLQKDYFIRDFYKMAATYSYKLE